jgi:hypothetical protein
MDGEPKPMCTRNGFDSPENRQHPRSPDDGCRLPRRNALPDNNFKVFVANQKRRLTPQIKAA